MKKKSIVQILVGFFLLVVQFMMQIKFNFNNFIFMACLLQFGSVPATHAIIVIGRCRLQ